MTRPPSSLGSYSENISANVGYEQYWGNLVNPQGIKFDYDYSHNWSRSMSRALTERYEMNGIPAQEDDMSSSGSTLSKNHRISASMAVDASKKVRFKWDSEVSFTGMDNISRQSGYTKVPGGEKMLSDMAQGSGKGSWRVSENVSMTIKPSRNAHHLGLNFSIGHEDVNAWDIDTTSSS